MSLNARDEVGGLHRREHAASAVEAERSGKLLLDWAVASTLDDGHSTAALVKNVDIVVSDDARRQGIDQTSLRIRH